MVRRHTSAADGASLALARVADALSYGVLVADASGDAVQANRSWEQLTGQRGESWRAGGWLRGGPADVHGRVEDDVLGDMRAGITHTTEWTIGDPTIDVDDETLTGQRVLEIEVQPVFEDGVLRWIVATASDVTWQRQRVQRLVEQATRDPLTGLYNRAQFVEFVRHSLDRQRREPDQRSTIFFVDVDELKATNDSLGHAAGDRTLRAAADAITSAVRPSDVVARYGGDEFTVLSESLGDAHEAAHIAARIREHVLDAGVGASVSVGYQIADEPDVDALAVIAEADRWMYRSRSMDPDRRRRMADHPASGATALAFDLVAVTAHELRTPLTAIIGFAATLKADKAQLTTDAQSIALDAIDRQAGRMADIIDQLLDLGRLRADGSSSGGSVDVHAVVADALDAAPPPDGVSVALAWPSPKLLAPVDRMSLERLVVNLLTNAYRHGGPQVRVDMADRGDHIEIAVEDDGPGIPESLESTLFQPFTRGKGHGGSGPAGTGLGLAIAFGLARSFGGDLGHERVAPHGTRMLVTMPVLRRQLQLAQPVPPD